LPYLLEFLHDRPGIAFQVSQQDPHLSNAGQPKIQE